MPSLLDAGLQREVGMTATLTASPPAPTTAAQPTHRPRRRWPVAAVLTTGAVLVLAALLWRSLAVPALVKFPTDVDQNPRYVGRFALFVDPATAAPLVEPTISDLTVDRHIEALPEESRASLVVVRETIAYEVEGLAAASHVHQYVMDRQTNANVDDPRAWAFEETNVLDRSGAYWVAMSKDVGSASTVPMYKDEIGDTFTAVGRPDTEVVDGLRLVGFEATGIAEPLTDAYLRSLDAVVPLPRSLTFDQLKPSLIAAGVPVNRAMAALVEVATPDDLAALAALVAEPIPLEYVLTFAGHTFVEPDTGAIVDVTSVVDRVSARPAAAAVPPLLTILERYREEPAIAAAIDGLDRLATQPLPVFEYRYAQTPASVEEIAAWVADQRDLIGLAERTIPLVLAGAGATALVIGGLVLVRRRVAEKDEG
jgi:hypothetical protein